MWLSRFEDLLERVEVGCHRRFDPGGSQGCQEPQYTGGWLEVHDIGQACPVAGRREQVADGGDEGADVPVDLQAAGRLKGGYFEAFLARVGDGTDLLVDGSDTHRSRGSL